VSQPRQKARRAATYPNTVRRFFELSLSVLELLSFPCTEGEDTLESFGKSSPLFRIALVVGVCAAATTVGVFSSPGLSLLLAVSISALYGGRLLSLLAILYSAFACAYLSLPSRSNVYLTKTEFVVIFCITAILVRTLILAKNSAESSRRSLAERYELFVNGAPMAIVFVDAEHRITNANPAAEEMFGVRESEMRNHLLDTLLPHIRYERSVKQKLTGIRGNGSPFHAEVAYGESILDGARIAAASINDVTEQTLAEEALRSTQSKLTRASQIAAVAELSATIAHELAQPITAMITNGEACLGWLSAPRPNYAQARIAAEGVIETGTVAAEIVRKTKGLFRRSIPAKVNLDINEVIREVIHLLAQRIDKAGMVVITDLNEMLPNVSADHVQMQQVLVNLLQNAIDSMEASEGNSIWVRTSKDASDSALIEIQDCGCGIDDAEKIFDPFFTTKDKGWGVGLSVCRSIIESHSGRLWAESVPGTGTMFRFTIPLAVKKAPTQEAVEIGSVIL